MADLYVPSRDAFLALAVEADLLATITDPSDDWDRRWLLTPPGIVWSIASDTCMSGRADAQHNIAYDEYGDEFRGDAGSVLSYLRDRH